MITGTGLRFNQPDVPLSGRLPADIERQADATGCYAYSLFNEWRVKVAGDWVVCPEVFNPKRKSNP